MGKSLPSASSAAKNLHKLGKIATQIMRTPKTPKSTSQVGASLPAPDRAGGAVDRKRKMETDDRNNDINCNSSSGSGGSSCEDARSCRMPLSAVVSDCARRWFRDTLREAKSGDVSMQVLVGQMYYNGYGVPKDVRKANSWMTRASRGRSSVWNVSYKRPGYLALASVSLS